MSYKSIGNTHNNPTTVNYETGFPFTNTKVPTGPHTITKGGKRKRKRIYKNTKKHKKKKRVRFA